jgi:four helix bundle protein
MDLALESYKLAALFPKSEIYGLRSQLQRAAVLAPATRRLKPVLRCEAT